MQCVGVFFVVGKQFIFRDSLMHSSLIDVFQPTKLDMLMGCSYLASLHSNWLYSLCLFHNSLPTCATDPHFTYICKLSCMLPTGHNDHAHITEYYCLSSSLVHNNPSNTVGAWIQPMIMILCTSLIPAISVS
jgi:hypothetical protein